MGGSAREIVLDIVSEFGCRNDSGGIYKLTSFTLDVFEAVNPKKSTWSPPEDQFGSLELFIRQCRHDIDTLPKFRPKRPINLTESELSALKSLRARNDIVIKPADKGGALVVWRADLYRDEAHRQLSDTAFYSRVDRDLTPPHQTTISNTIHTFINGDLPHTAKNLISITPRHLSCTFFPKSTNLITQVDP